MVGIGVVAFGGKDEEINELGVTIERADTLDDIAIEHLECLARDDDFATDELWAAGREVFVDDFVELARVLEREPKQ